MVDLLLCYSSKTYLPPIIAHTIDMCIMYVCIFIQSISISYNVFTVNKFTTRIDQMD